MRLSIVVTLMAMVVGSVQAEELKSGPQVGDQVPGPFEPLNVTGENAGDECCLYCKYGTRPVAVVFAKTLTPEVKTLVEKINAANAKNKAMGSYMVVNQTDDKTIRELKKLANQSELNHTVLSVMATGEPKHYEIDPNAEVTVLLYTNGVVKSNFAFKKGSLDTKGIDKILSDLPKILTAK